MKTLNIASATKRYNDIMMSMGWEHNQIGTEFSEGTENWNLRDMLEEIEYALSTYYEEGHTNYEFRTSSEPDERKIAKNEIAKIKRFIEAYEPFAKGMEANAGH